MLSYTNDRKKMTGGFANPIPSAAARRRNYPQIIGSQPILVTIDTTLLSAAGLLLLLLRTLPSPLVMRSTGYPHLDLLNQPLVRCEVTTSSEDGIVTGSAVIEIAGDMKTTAIIPGTMMCGTMIHARTVTTHGPFLVSQMTGNGRAVKIKTGGVELTDGATATATDGEKTTDGVTANQTTAILD